ncbi:MAG: 3-hydroxybutyrate oligomer hydrolase family protein [Prochloraceae cyanobacterium]
MKIRTKIWLCAIALVFLLLGCTSLKPEIDVTKKPWFIKGEIQKTIYDGVNDDLLSAGIGLEGMLERKPPPLAAPENPTSADLRRLAVYNNFRALVDPSPQYLGKIYGPGANHDEELIAGEEYLAYADDGSRRQNVTLMVQIPSTFEPQSACIVTGTSSGSRGIYGAIGTSGDWGLKKGCVVVYNDKGTGLGVHDLTTNTINLINGLREDADKAGKLSNFTIMTDKTKREAFNTKFPHRVAFKHAHSQQNPEKDWGKHVLQSLHFAFYLLNQKYGIGTITPPNTIVIASSVSNGAGSALRAAEQDVYGLIDGIAVSEPNVSPIYNDSFKIVQGNNPPTSEHSKPLLDYQTLLHVYQPCANLANSKAPFNIGEPPLGIPRELGENRCQSLKEKGLLKADTVEEQAEEAQKIINAHSILVEQNILQP